VRSREAGKGLGIIWVDGLEITVTVTGLGVASITVPTSLYASSKGGAVKLGRLVVREGGGAEVALLEETASFLAVLLGGGRPPAIPRVDLSGLTPFTVKVLEKTMEIPWGELRSYSWLAGRAGAPGAARAAGGAVGRNPVPLLVPCHRVVRSDGTIGGFGLGTPCKRWLLSLEGVCDPALQGGGAGEESKWR